MLDLQVRGQGSFASLIVVGQVEICHAWQVQQKYHCYFCWGKACSHKVLFCQVVVFIEQAQVSNAHHPGSIQHDWRGRTSFDRRSIWLDQRRCAEMRCIEPEVWSGHPSHSIHIKDCVHLSSIQFVCLQHVRANALQVRWLSAAARSKPILDHRARLGVFGQSKGSSLCHVMCQRKSARAFTQRPTRLMDII